MFHLSFVSMATSRPPAAAFPGVPGAYTYPEIAGALQRAADRAPQHVHPASPAAAQVDQVPPLSRQWIKGGIGVGGGTCEGDPIELETEGAGGHSKGDLDRILQEQLARLRSSWSHERC